MSKRAIQVTILDDRLQENCEAECGTDWSSAEMLDLARQRIGESFGDRVRLEYLDLAEAHSADVLQWKEELRHKGLSLPLLLLNGHLRLSGQFDIRRLLDTIEAETEIGAQRW